MEDMDKVSMPAPSTASEGISYQEFSAMFETDGQGFNYMHMVSKLEDYDRVRHHGMKCGATGYNIVGPRYHCTNGNFSLCATSYAEMMVPSTGKQLEQYIFNEIALEDQTTKLKKLACYSPASTVTLE